jgi:hypothetical protein
MSTLVAYAKQELKAAGLYDDDAEYGGDIKDAVLELVTTFAKQGHSGGSAPIVVSLFSKLASFEPLGPITGAEAEWVEVDGGVFQNARCGSVFKAGKDGKPYYLDAIIWRTQTGNTYSGSAQLIDGTIILCRQYVRFPFTPKSFYVDVIEEEIKKDDWKFTVKDGSQLGEVFGYYDLYKF